MSVRTKISVTQSESPLLLKIAIKNVTKITGGMKDNAINIQYEIFLTFEIGS
ncbi:hypothetical protein [Mesoplasma chauliocola]|uniref:hypothetical protein n=1 Tax=Mesoplasma chauliocola TaxID=216427 RepID=UPI0004BB1D72|nr:hypothetical protein [Mesoplasma chauliocola]